MTQPLRSRAMAGLCATALLLLSWDASGLDLSVAAWSGSSAGFPLRDDWMLTTVLHQGGRAAAWVAALVLCIGVWWPFGVLARLTLVERVQLAMTPLIAVFVVNLLKRASGASCPWDMDLFGGVVQPLSHWVAYLRSDGGGGHCFPAGHASSGFAYVGIWLVLRRHAPRVALAALAASLAAGFVLGFAQQMRGAHFLSHTLWTLWVCVCTAWVVDVLLQSQRRQGALA